MNYFYAILLVLFLHNARGAVITVDHAGNGDHTTISAGVNAASAGDTVTVKDGVYNERVTVGTAGTAGSPLVIRSENRHGAKMRGFTVTADYVTIDGFEIADTDTSSWKGEDGIRADGTMHVRAVNNHIHDIYWGAGVWTGRHTYVGGNRISRVYMGVMAFNNSLIEDNRIDDLYEKSGSPYKRKNTFIFLQGDSITIRANYMYNDELIGHFVHASDWAQFNPVSSSDIMIERNICFGAMHGSEPDGARRAESVRWTYRNNVFVNTKYVGICLKFLGEVKILNNTFINCGSYPVWFQDMVAGNSEIKNNIFAYSDSLPSGAHSGVTGWQHANSFTPETGNNLYYGINVWKTQFIGPNEKKFTPAFVSFTPHDTATADFMLAGTCEAVDGGAATDLVTTDQRGYGRPAGSAPDVGAYEYGAVPVGIREATPIRITRSELAIAPLPAADAFTVTGNRMLGSVRIINTAGQVMWQGSTGSSMLRINPGNALPPGQYILTAGDGTHLTSFTVSR